MKYRVKVLESFKKNIEEPYRWPSRQKISENKTSHMKQRVDRENKIPKRKITEY